MKPKKILIVCQHFWPETFRINDISEFLVNEKNCEVEVLCGIPNYPKGTFYDGYSYTKNRKQIHNGVHIRRTFEIPRGNNTNVKIFLNYVSFPIASLFHIPRLLFGKYDKILIYQLSPVMMSIAGIIVGKLKRIETTMYVLDLWPENLFSVIPIKNRVLKRLLTNISHWHYKRVDKVVALSKKMKKRLQEITGRDNVTILPQACEKIYEEIMHDTRLRIKYKHGFNVLFTGNISPAQSFETMLDAAQKLRSEGLAINWIIVGDGMSRKWLEGEVKNRKLSDTFFFEGQHPIESIPKYTDIADVLVGCLVKSELLEATIPAKVLSYIAAGKPIVLAMDGEAQTLINNTIKCGYAGPAGDEDALYKNMKNLYDTSEIERKEMGERARRYHFKHFERNIVLNKLYDFIFDER
jgi:colanic acid biosynthesis glycosyl transferase WcaI